MAFDRKKYNRVKLLGVRVDALIEILLFFVVMFLISWLFGLERNFYSVCPHPFWIIIILIATQYGTIEGLIAAFVATILFWLGPIPAQTILQDRFEYLFFVIKTPLIWFSAAVILGELRLRQIRERDALQKIASQAEEKEHKMAEAYENLKKIKERLEVHVAGDLQTSLMVISAFKTLEQSGKAGIIRGASQLMQAVIAPQKSSVFWLSPGELNCVLDDGWEPEDHYAKRLTSESPLYQEIMSHKRAVLIQTANPTILGEEGELAAPIIDLRTNKLFGMLKVEAIPRMRLTMTTIESLRTIAELVGAACANYMEREGKK